MEHSRKRIALLCCISVVLLICLLSYCGLGRKDPALVSNSSIDINSLNALGRIEVIVREDGSGTRAVLNEIVGIISKESSGYTVDKTTDKARIAFSTEDAIQYVAENENAIGYASIGVLHNRSDIRVLSLEGIEGTKENMNNGKYKLFRPFLIAYIGEPDGVGNDFLNYLLSAGQAIVEQNYLSVRRTTSFLSDRSAGTVTVEGSSSMAALMEKLAEEYMKINKNAAIEISVSDTSIGLTKAMQRRCDFAVSSRPLRDYEKELLNYKEIAKDGIAVIVHSDNTVADITINQIFDVFTGNKDTWADIYR